MVLQDVVVALVAHRVFGVAHLQLHAEHQELVVLGYLGQLVDLVELL